MSKWLATLWRLIEKLLRLFYLSPLPIPKAQKGRSSWPSGRLVYEMPPTGFVPGASTRSVLQGYR